MALSTIPARKKLFLLGGLGVIGVVTVIIVLLCGVGEPDLPGDTEQERVQALARTSSKSTLASAAENKSPRIRMAAMVRLTQVMDAEDRPIIEKAITDESPDVRALAAESLGQFNDAEATRKLAAIAASTKEDAKVRQAALRGLVPCEAPQAVVTLIEVAADESAPNKVRFQAGKSALAKAGGKLNPDRRPENKALWRDLIQRLKNDQRVRRAYGDAGVKLVDHSNDIVTD